MPKITAHALVRNEENWVWYALNSVIDYVDEILVWDTGSLDRTVEVVKSIKSPKLKFRQLPPTADESQLSRIRNQMLEETKDGWIMVLDGDEVWPDLSIKTCTRIIQSQGNEYESIIVPTLNCIGDVYHVSPPSAGRYKLAGRIGHLNMRFISQKIPGLHVSNPPGQLQSYCDGLGVKVQDRNPKRVLFTDSPYMHMTHLARSGRRENEINVFWRGKKRKVELGDSLPKNFSYPSVFYWPTPSVVPDPWRHRSPGFTMAAVILSPLKYIKRSITAI